MHLPFSYAKSYLTVSVKSALHGITATIMHTLKNVLKRYEDMQAFYVQNNVQNKQKSKGVIGYVLKFKMGKNS